MRLLETEIEINAPRERVWRTFSDTARWPEWNPFVTSFQGELKRGEKVRVRLEPPNGRGMTFKPTIVAIEPDEELRWLGRLLIPGLFDGEHRFRLQAIDEQRTRFLQSEEFSGVLVTFILNEEQIRRGFESMNTALKNRVEEERQADPKQP